MFLRVSSLWLLSSCFQSLFRRRHSCDLPLLRHAQRLPDVRLVLLELMLEDLPVIWFVSWLPCEESNRDPAQHRGRERMPRPPGEGGLQYYWGFASQVPQVSNVTRTHTSDLYYSHRTNSQSQCFTFRWFHLHLFLYAPNDYSKHHTACVILTVTRYSCKQD